MRYVIVLIFVFLLIVFAYPVLQNIARADAISLPDLTNESAEYRSFLALLILTGLLSSIPGLKDVDSWLIRTLHREAFIPDDVRDFAAKLFQSTYTPSTNTKIAVRPTLSMRDTARVADGLASGSLERRIFELLCARTQIQTVMKEDSYRRVRIQFDQDIVAMETQAKSLKGDIISYLRQQEKLVPPDIPDIDAFMLNNIDKDGMEDLFERRKSLLLRCDTQYELICLMAGLALFATTSAAEEIDTAVKKMGFEAKVDRVPALDWDAVMKVTVSAILVLLIFNGLYVVIWNQFDLVASFAPSAEPTKASIIRFALLFTIAYTIIMWLAIQLKRRWRRLGPIAKRPENLLIAVASYGSTVWINVIINYYLTAGHPTYAPLLFALNQAVFGYFMGAYIDRHVDGKPLSIKLAIFQGLAQAVAMSVATTFLPSLASDQTTLVLFRITGILGVFSMFQSGASGFVVGVLFQYFYNRAPNSIPESPLVGSVEENEHKGKQLDRAIAARASP